MNTLLKYVMKKIKIINNFNIKTYSSSLDYINSKR